MTAGARQAQRTELLAEIRQSNLSTSAKRELAALVNRRRRSDAELLRANLERAERVRAGIHRAADRHLTEPFRQFTHRSGWAGALWRYLERRHAQYGLARCPCLRVIRRELKNWTPPIGGAE